MIVSLGCLLKSECEDFERLVVFYLDMQTEFSLVHFRNLTTALAETEEPFKLSVLLEMFDEITKLFRNFVII